MKRMIAYCGLDCEKCDAYVATVNNDNALREKTAKLWAELNNAPITADMINCNGCRENGVKTPFCESMCTIRQCALHNGKTTCGECAEMNGCQKLSFIFDNSEEAKRNLTEQE